MSSKRTCANCAQTFSVQAPSGQLVAYPWCGAAVKAPSPAVTARPPAPRTAPPTNGHAVRTARRDPPAPSTSPAWIVFVVIGAFGLLGIGVIAIVVLAAFVFLRSTTATTPPAVAMTSDVAIVENE